MTDYALRYLNAHHPLVLYAAAFLALCSIALLAWALGWRVRNHLVGAAVGVATAYWLGVWSERLRHRIARPQGGAALNDVETTEGADAFTMPPARTRNVKVRVTSRRRVGPAEPPDDL